MVTWALRKARTVIIAIIGFTVLGAGLAMLVLPGPAVVVMPVGLAILATEFVWAQGLLTRAKATLVRIRERMASRNGIPSKRSV